MSQNSLILNHLKSGQSITPIDALNLYGSFRLSGRIKDLRYEGYDIETIPVKNNGKRYASYKLKVKGDLFI